MTRSMGSHQSTNMKSDIWLTPPHIIQSLGEFDLDPCCPSEMPWKTANKSYTQIENGLIQPWEGRVWLNPPYSREATKWLKKLAQHGNGVALVFARTETTWFFENIWKKAHALLFLEGRIHFHLLNGERAQANAGAPSVLVAYGKNNVNSLLESGIKGVLVNNWKIY